MNPKPLSSLNHLTVPVAIVLPPTFSCAANVEIAESKATTAHTACVGQPAQPNWDTLTATGREPQATRRGAHVRGALRAQALPCIAIAGTPRRYAPSARGG